MELDNLVTQDLADNGVWSPVMLYGKPADFDLLILGEDSDIVQQYSRKSLKKIKSFMGRTARSDKIELDDEAIDELADSSGEAVLIRIAGIRGWDVERKGSKEISRKPEKVTLGGVELKNDRASYALLIKKIPAVKEFVLQVSGDRANFLSKPSGN
jgi:hypothetical protein